MWREIHAGRGPSEQGVNELVRDSAQVFSIGERERLGRVLGADVLGAGVLEPLFSQPGVTDILVNGPRDVWLDRGNGLERANIELTDADAVRRLAVRLATAAGRRLDDASPYVDCVLPGGVRLHAILPPLVEGSPHLSLRVPAQRRPTLQELIESGSIASDVAPVLRGLIRQRVAFVVSGGTGSGKTTLLGALLADVAADERIVLVEDVRELAIRHPHVVRLEARAPNVEGAGEITLTTLVRQSLRMRPDRVVVGEVRGGEVRELMAALNTGHQGGCGTIHANAPADVPARFEALGALAGMSPSAVRSQLRSALNVVIHVERERAGRRIASIGLIEGDHEGLSVRLAWKDGTAREAWSQLLERCGRGGGEEA